jgi:hypothetical protein
MEDNMKRNLFFSLIAVSMMATAAHADGLRLGDPGYGGTGCPAGSASVTLSPDQTALSILFDKYQVESGRPTSLVVDRKSCNIAIPVHVPNGISVGVFRVDYRGFNLLPSGGRSRFQAEYFWAGSRGPVFNRTFVGPLNDNYTITNNLLAQTIVWAPCGASVNLRVNSSMMVQTNAAREQSMATVDSADIGSALIFHLQFRHCTM